MLYVTLYRCRNDMHTLHDETQRSVPGKKKIPEIPHGVARSVLWKIKDTVSATDLGECLMLAAS